MEHFERQFIGFLADGDDRSAFALLYEGYWEPLFLYAARAIQNKEDAIDIVQETFIALWEQRQQVPAVQSLKAYLFAIARYKSLQYIRKHIHREDYADSLAAFLTRHEQSPEELLMADELQQLIDDEIQQFPKKMRVIFTLSRHENLSYKEIAEKLQLSDKTVKKQISNSLKLLRLKITNHYLPLLVFLMVNAWFK
ncbi:RNA polymerase sigma-70 factor [Parapedobacter lycopersici]|uniref:RNA polymerase sigma-70 factor n=1 Tax=Parapedobacter lycopersici TaxID=1864939 RepID=UPI00333F71AF